MPLNSVVWRTKCQILFSCKAYYVRRKYTSYFRWISTREALVLNPKCWASGDKLYRKLWLSDEFQWFRDSGISIGPTRYDEYETWQMPIWSLNEYLFNKGKAERRPFENAWKNFLISRKTGTACGSIGHSMAERLKASFLRRKDWLTL